MMMIKKVAGVQGFEPWKWRNQNPLPYRLAIPQLFDGGYDGTRTYDPRIMSAML